MAEQVESKLVVASNDVRGNGDHVVTKLDVAFFAEYPIEDAHGCFIPLKSLDYTTVRPTSANTIRKTPKMTVTGLVGIRSTNRQ